MKNDILAKEFYSDNDRFADIINGIGCLGQQVLSGEDLQDRDGQTGFFRFPEFIRRQKEKYRTSRSGTLKIRDLVRKTSFGVNFAIIGIENQETIDYSIVLRSLSYDAGKYGRQYADIRRLTDTSMFHTDVRQVFDFIRYSKNPEKLKELVTKNKAYQELEEDTYDLISEYTHAEELVQVKEYYKKDGVVNMCEALTILIENGKAEGIAKGRTEGKAEAVLTLLAELGNIPEGMKEQILQETNLDKLNQWLKLAARAESVQEFEDQW